MGSTQPPPPETLHDPAPEPDALLELVDSSPIDWASLADHLRQDPVLLHALFHALPLTPEQSEQTLPERIVPRLETLGADLLKLWLLSRAPASASRTDQPVRALALRTAAIAHELAQATGFSRPDEAALAGLWSRLAQLLKLSPGQGAAQLPLRVFNARLAEECGASPALCDALLLADAPEEQAMQAHPLAALLWCAVRLAGNSSNASLAAVSRICRLSPQELRERLAQHAAATAAAPSDPSLPAPSSYPQAAATPDPRLTRLLRSALPGFTRGAFDGLDSELLRPRYLAACKLLAGLQPALVLLARDEHIMALPLGADTLTSAAQNELCQPLEDESSLVALAIRSHTPTAYQHDNGEAPGRSVRDWQLARWLGRAGFVCIPFGTDGAPGARGALVVTPAHTGTAHDAARMLVSLSAAAVSAALARQEREEQAAEQLRRSEQAHREHARRIAHEARNPLSVIRSYLQLLPERHKAPGLAEELRIVHEEIGRLESLIDRAGRAPEAEPEAPHCHVMELLHDLRALLGEALFGSRGIHFELRTLPNLPPVAMPASALRQVLLNLLRNAAEVLHPGGRCTLALAGELIVDGQHCLEIRIIDNGPGLPAERLRELFSPSDSHKGGAHQGLGLAVTREILEHWQARILCRSQHAVGTSFQLLVPLQISE